MSSAEDDSSFTLLRDISSPRTRDMKLLNDADIGKVHAYAHLPETVWRIGIKRSQSGREAAFSSSFASVESRSPLAYRRCSTDLCYTSRIAWLGLWMTVIPIRLTRKDARKLDLLVKLGIYQSRTEAIRSMVNAKADEQVTQHLANEKTLRVLKRLLEYEGKEGKNPLRILSDKTAVEIVAEGRE
ncbi:MAG: ribbon-helix-helix domain-containing protein [Candidatus Bathyarchaeia archaeon]